jgi:hypothetical protein
VRNGDVVEVRAACRKSRRSGWEGRCTWTHTSRSRLSWQIARSWRGGRKAPLAAIGMEQIG